MVSKEDSLIRTDNNTNIHGVLIVLSPTRKETSYSDRRF
jgi:hypothetical protein